VAAFVDEKFKGRGFVVDEEKLRKINDVLKKRIGDRQDISLLYEVKRADSFKYTTTDAADAKARIAVYGSLPVVSALARFEEAGAILTDGTPAEAFISLVSSMRRGQATVSERDLRTVLLGPQNKAMGPVSVSHPS
jgi:hypothetical protein